jgi:DNA-binding LacI/PurR family transcriptional regulator
MRKRILSLKKRMSLYDVALDIGISESTLYNYINNYKKISRKSLEKIEKYFRKREENYENTTSQ